MFIKGYRILRQYTGPRPGDMGEKYIVFLVFPLHFINFLLKGKIELEESFHFYYRHSVYFTRGRRRRREEGEYGVYFVAKLSLQRLTG